MSVKTILVAHRSLAVRDRFAAALAEAQQDYLLAGGAAALRTALAGDRAAVSLALVDLSMAEGSDAVAFVREIRSTGLRTFPVVVFAGSVASSDQIAMLGAAGVAGYVNEHADPQQILPALAPHLFPDNFNRRSSPRASVAVPVSVRAGATIVATQTRDLGRGGTCIQTMDPLPQGVSLQMRIRLPGGAKEIAADGRVIWSDRRLGMGVQFEKLTLEAQGQLEEYLSHASSA